MPQSAFIVRPFGRKSFVPSQKAVGELDQLLQAQHGGGMGRELLRRAGDAPASEWSIDFDAIEDVLIKPALCKARIRGETTGAVVEAGNIREDMFNRLITADLVIADVSLHNPNVFYELGLRQAFRDKFTFVIRCDLSVYPFDLQTDRYFDYPLAELIRAPDEVVARLTTALRKTLNQYRADSPVFKLMPQLEAEDRSRFLSVPEDFREEVERAQRQRQREMLDLLGLECEDHLWEIEGLRVVGRAQFEANFIDGAKTTWTRIAARYPDDAEANTVLSTVYQRLQDRTRSEQALARVTRSRTLSPSRLSELRALTGRNLKAAWIDQWRHAGEGRRIEALRSPLLQRAIDAYMDAFKLDLNNSYAGLNALTLLVIQAELIDGLPDEWRRLQRVPGDEQREFEQRAERIDQLAQALLLALESERDRLVHHGQGDPWFTMLEAAVMCTVSSQPDYVAQLYVEACYYAPPKSDASMVAALQMYRDLGIRGLFKSPARPRRLGTLGDNVDRALEALRVNEAKDDVEHKPTRLLVFVGLRADEHPRMGKPIFPPSLESGVAARIEAEIEREAQGGRGLLAMAGGASGGDILFHEICRRQGIPAQMFLALTKPQHIGAYVAPAGSGWVSRFNDIHRSLSQRAADREPHRWSGIRVFSDSADLPRWLQDRDLYNVGRRSMLWMLQHASNMSRSLGGGVEITLIALRSPESELPGAFGGIHHAIRLAQMHGVNVRLIDLPTESGAPRPGDERHAAPSAEAAPEAISTESAVRAGEDACASPEPSAAAAATKTSRRHRSSAPQPSFTTNAAASAQNKMR